MVKQLLFTLLILHLLHKENEIKKITVEVSEQKVESIMDLGNLPATIRNSKILTGKHLQQLADVDEVPMVNPAFEDDKLKNIFQYFSTDPLEMETELHQYAGELLDIEKVTEAWQVLLALI